MEYQVYKNEEEVGKVAGMIIAMQAVKKANSVLGFATGSTPVPTYQTMIRLFNEGIVDFSKVRTYNLDEYCGLAADHDQSFCYFMMQNLFNHINVPQNQIHIPNGLAKDIDKECAAYEAAIDADGGLDLQLLGIGENGHIGFNEPADAFVFDTHQTTLTKSTIEANKRFFDSADDVPRAAITMGIGTIMKSREILFIATGKAKAQTVKDMLQKDPSPACQASVLRFHPNVSILLDEAAASLL